MCTSYTNEYAWNKRKKEGIKRQNDNMGILPGDSINHQNDKIGESGDFDIFSMITMCKKAHFLTDAF